MSSGRDIKKVLIIGGGFAGVAVAQNLKNHTDKLDITLVSNKSFLEYYPSLYRVVTGRSPLEACIPLSTIFPDKKIKIVEDHIESIDKEKQTAQGQSGSEYCWDFAVMAIGSEQAYFDVPGLKENAFTLRSVNDALKIKRHIHEIFNKHKTTEPIHIIVAGGGATGVELSAELAIYTRKLAKQYNIDPATIIIELFESNSRLLHQLSIKVSQETEKRLRKLGVNIYLNSPITKADIERVYLPQLVVKSKTVIWTVGTEGTELATETTENTDKGKRIKTNQYLQLEETPSIYAIGDAAATTYSGLAQTAINDGHFVAKQIIRQVNGQELKEYTPKPVVHAIPIGYNWAIVSTKHMLLTGKTAWIIRRLADLNYFLDILPTKSAIQAFKDGSELFETCPECFNNLETSK